MNWIKTKYVDIVTLPKTYSEKLLETIKIALPIVRDYATEIILYGSAARGTLLYGSDLDIMVVIKNECADSRVELLTKLSMSCVEENDEVPVDIIVRTAQFMDKNEAFQMNIRKDKKVLWRNDEV